MTFVDTDHRRASAVRTTGHWFGDPARPQLGWLTVPAGRPTASAFVIAPPVGYAYLCAHRALRTIAEGLAARGHCVLRVDYDGTGDSAGDQWEPDRLPAWRGTVSAAVDALRTAGMETITLAGVRLGATLALFDASALGADAVIAWAPVVSGRRFTRELQMLGAAVPDEHANEPGTFVSAGNVFSAQTLDAIKGLSLDRLDAAPAPRVLLVGDPGTIDATADALTTLGTEVRCAEIEGGEAALETPAEYGTVPVEIVEAICAYAGEVSAPVHPIRVQSGAGRRRRTGARGTPRPTDLARWSRSRRRCSLSTHTDRRDRDRAGHAAKPGRGDAGDSSTPDRRPTPAPDAAGSSTPATWPVSATAWSGSTGAAGGIESPGDGRAPGRPYADGLIEDTAAIVDALRALGHERVVLSGLCASAWVALQALDANAAAGAIVLNLPRSSGSRGSRSSSRPTRRSATTPRSTTAISAWQAAPRGCEARWTP